MTEPASIVNQPCPACQAGHLHPARITYFTWLVDELITVPNFPAWVCDVCGRREYDQHAINEISLLLAPHAGKSNTAAKTTKPKAWKPGNTRSGTRDQK